MNKRIADLRTTGRGKEDDGDRTSRVRTLERELNNVLDENNVSERIGFIFTITDGNVLFSKCIMSIKPYRRKPRFSNNKAYNMHIISMNYRMK